MYHLHYKKDHTLCHRASNLLKRSQMTATYIVASMKSASDRLNVATLDCHNDISVRYLNYLNAQRFIRMPLVI